MVATPAPQRAASRRALAKRGRALPDGSFPIPNGEYWDKARQAIGRVKDPEKRAKVARLLRKTAPQVGRTAQLKQSWAAHANDSGGIGLADGPEPYRRGPDETVHCPNCGKYDAPDARYCDQCGHKLPPSAYKDLSNSYDFAVTTKDSQGFTLVCPECNYSGPASRFGANGAKVGSSPLLRTPAPGTGYARKGVPLTVRASAPHALANSGGGVELATATARRHPVRGPGDVLAARGENGTAVLRHRHGGPDIATLRKTDDGKWIATVNGRDLEPRGMQRAALFDAVSTWNKALTSAVRPQDAPLQPVPVQTALMEQMGIPAMRAATFATPTTSSSGGPRMTAAGGKGSDPDHDGDDDYSVKGDTDKDYAGGLGPKGRAAYRKLCAKGMPKARALMLARHVDSMSGAKAA